MPPSENPPSPLRQKVGVHLSGLCTMSALSPAAWAVPEVWERYKCVQLGRRKGRL